MKKKSVNDIFDLNHWFATLQIFLLRQKIAQAIRATAPKFLLKSLSLQNEYL